MPQLKRKLTMTAVGVAVVLGVGDTADATGPKGGERAAKPCGAGLLHVIVVAAISAVPLPTSVLPSAARRLQTASAARLRTE